MAYKINDECIACGACESECPVEAISEGDGKYEIDAEKCISCGAWRERVPRVRSGRGVSLGLFVRHITSA